MSTATLSLPSIRRIGAVHFGARLVANVVCGAILLVALARPISLKFPG